MGMINITISTHILLENRSLHKTLRKNIRIPIISFCQKEKKKGLKLSFVLVMTIFVLYHFVF